MAVKQSPSNARPNTAQALQRAAERHRQGQLDEAERLYRAILATQPNHFEVLYRLGTLHYQQGRYPEALRYVGAALKVNPKEPAAWSNLGFVQASLGDSENALVSYDRALALKPHSAEAHNNRGNVLVDLKRIEEALASYDKALALKPGYADALNNRGSALRELRRPAEALVHFDKALALKPDYVEAHINRGNALKDLHRADEALASYDEALALRPDHPEAYDGKGLALIELGRSAEATIALETAISLAPARARHYYNLTVSKRMSRGDPQLRAMEELEADSSSLKTEEQIFLHFALAKTYADIGDRERSFRRLSAGNALKRRQIVYDEAAVLSGLERAKAAFTSGLMSRHAGVGEPSRAPVFIVGMPRSGTTLVEQILASHPEVFGAGEIADFDEALAGLGVADGAPNSPEVLSLTSGEQFRQIGADYVARIRSLAPGAARIVNKTPGNFALTGLIHLALPSARIIHMRRDPVDTGLSCFSSLFVGDLPYAYDLGELGRYYRAYETLMAHWRAVLPEGAMLEVRYEDVVADLQGQARRLVDYCGLAWDARCLDFHRTKRQVRTASATQVRQPLYKSSVRRWRAYEPFLGPLLAELGPSIARDGADREIRAGWGGRLNAFAGVLKSMVARPGGAGRA